VLTERVWKLNCTLGTCRSVVQLKGSTSQWNAMLFRYLWDRAKSGDSTLLPTDVRQDQ
jgi:hypothetical protein